MASIKIDRLLRAGIVVLAGLLVFVIYGSIHEHVVVTGDKAPDFTLTADGGRPVSIPNFGGKILVLNFWASWCQPCLEETPSLSAFADQYKDKGVVVLAVSVDKDAAAYQKFVEHFRPAFLTVRDAKIHEDFGTFIYPETYIIDANGRVLQKYAEPENWMNPKLTGFIDSLLKS